MKKLFFVRHGETHMNVADTLSGQTETPLTDKGIKQAMIAAKKIKSITPRIDYIICSPYERATHTAQIIAKEIGFPSDKIEQNDLFIERNWGVLETTPAMDFLNTHSYEEFDNVEGAETVKQLQERAVRAFEYVKTVPMDNILIVSHGSFGRAFWRVVNNLPHTQEFQKTFRIGNAEILELI